MDIRVNLIANSRASAAINVSYTGIMVWPRALMTAQTAFVRLWE